MSLATDSSDVCGCAFASAVLGVVGGHALLLGLAIDSVVSIVESFASDGVFEVEVSLGDVRLGDSSKK